MSALFDFRVSDRNLGGSVGAGFSTSAPAQFVGAAARNLSGAALPGRVYSFVKIPLQSPGCQAFVTPNKEYSVFFSIDRSPRVPSEMIHLWRVVTSGGSNTPFCAFAYFSGSKVKFANLFTRLTGFLTDASLPLEPLKKFYMGLSYSRASGAHTVVYNGTAFSVSMKTNYKLNIDAEYTEIWLGSQGTRNSDAFEGRINCFALAPLSMMAEDFQALGSVC